MTTPQNPSDTPGHVGVLNTSPTEPHNATGPLSEPWTYERYAAFYADTYNAVKQSTDIKPADDLVTKHRRRAAASRKAWRVRLRQQEATRAQREAWMTEHADAHRIGPNHPRRA